MTIRWKKSKFENRNIENIVISILAILFSYFWIEPSYSIIVALKYILIFLNLYFLVFNIIEILKQRYTSLYSLVDMLN
ncbi:hypothetical protein AM598_05370 [Paenibacillus polymyxa]|nr:hypothetical protein AM598_05370 [Paenibacillus polymyxa]